MGLRLADQHPHRVPHGAAFRTCKTLSAVTGHGHDENIYNAVMRTHVRLSRPQRAARTARQLSRPVLLARRVVRREVPIPAGEISASRLPCSIWSGFQPDPYADYGRFLTPEGGILLIYKDLDLRLRHMAWRLLAWTG